MQRPKRATRSHKSSFDLQRTDTPPDSLKLVMILCATDGGISFCLRFTQRPNFFEIGVAFYKGESPVNLGYMFLVSGKKLENLDKTVKR